MANLISGTWLVYTSNSTLCDELGIVGEIVGVVGRFGDRAVRFETCGWRRVAVPTARTQSLQQGSSSREDGEGFERGADAAAVLREGWPLRGQKRGDGIEPPTAMRKMCGASTPVRG
jgi:hypothetical protein